MFTSIFFYYHFRGIALLLIPFFSSANIKNFEKQNETVRWRKKGIRVKELTDFEKEKRNRTAYSTSSTSECAGKLPVDWRQCVTALWQLFVSGRFRANWCKRHSQGLLRKSTCSWGVGSTPQTLLGLHSNLFHVGMQTRSTISEPDGVCMCSCQSCLKKRKSPFPIRVKYSCCLWNVGFIIHVYFLFCSK